MIFDQQLLFLRDLLEFRNFFFFFYKTLLHYVWIVLKLLSKRVRDFEPHNSTDTHNQQHKKTQVNQQDTDQWRQCQSIEYLTTQSENKSCQMIEFKGSVVKTDCIVIRLPFPYNDQVNETNSKHQIQAVLTDLLEKHVDHQNDLN